jgi:hypothetical protein
MASISLFNMDTEEIEVFQADEHNVIRTPEGRYALVGEIPLAEIRLSSTLYLPSITEASRYKSRNDYSEVSG